MSELKKKRILAAVTDALLLLLADAAIGAVIYFTDGALWLMAPVCLAVHLVYCTAFLCSPMCATPGMRFWKLSVCDTQRRTASFGRVLFRAAASFFSCLILGFGLWYILADANDCTLYDYASGTMVRSAEQSNAACSVPCLIETGDPARKKHSFAEQDSLMIGRNPVTCQIVLPADEPCVSRIHCRVRFNPQTGTLLLKDMGSSYGTYLKDGSRLQEDQVAVLESGEEFYVGTPKNMFMFFMNAGGNAAC